MEYEVEVPGQKILEQRLWKKTVRHVDWIGRMPWTVLDGWSRLETIDDHDGCEWVNGNGSPGCPRQNP